MQLGDILKPKVGTVKMIITYITKKGEYCSLMEDGRTISDDDIFFLRYYKLVSSHNGSLKAGMKEFMEKYYKGE